MGICCFYLLTAATHAAVNVPVRVFVGYVLSFLMGRYLRMELLGCIVDLRLTF